MSEKPLSNQLKMPEGVSSTGPVSDVTEAYVNAVIAIPAILDNIATELSAMNDFLSVLSLYAEKRGVNEGIIAPDEIEKDGDDDGKESAAN